MASKKTALEKEISKERRFRLAGVNTRSTFILVQPLIQDTSKSLLTVATVTFAGSLTFLGLTSSYAHTSYLKWSWVLLAASVAAHLFTSIASLDSLISHGRTETEAERASSL